MCARACHVRCRVVLAVQFPQLPSPTIPLQLPWVQLLVPVRMHGAARAQRQLKLGGPGVSWDFAVSVFGGILALSSSHPGPSWYHAGGVLGPSWLILIAAAQARQLLFFGEAARGRKDNGRCAKIGHLGSSSAPEYELPTTIHLSSSSSQRPCHQGSSVYAQISLRAPPSGTLARQNLPCIPQRWLQSVPALR